MLRCDPAHHHVAVPVVAQQHAVGELNPGLVIAHLRFRPAKVNDLAMEPVNAVLFDQCLDDRR